jgi:hypothetical protein
MQSTDEMPRLTLRLDEVAKLTGMSVRTVQRSRLEVEVGGPPPREPIPPDRHPVNFEGRVAIGRPRRPFLLHERTSHARRHGERQGQ